MNILGINSFFEHPSIAIVSNGQLLFAIEEERHTGIKGGKRYTPYSNVYIPFKSIYSGLEYLGMTAYDIDMIGYSYNKWLHCLDSIRSLTGQKKTPFIDEISAFWGLLNSKRALTGRYDLLCSMREHLPIGSLSSKPFISFNHHLCHAASAFYCSGFEESLILVVDGSGEDSSTQLYLGDNNKIISLKKFNIPNSLGYLYSFITKFLGFNAYMDEYKVMGLLAYGKAKYEQKFREFIVYDDKGNYKLLKQNFFKSKRDTWISS